MMYIVCKTDRLRARAYTDQHTAQICTARRRTHICRLSGRKFAGGYILVCRRQIKNLPLAKFIFAVYPVRNLPSASETLADGKRFICRRQTENLQSKRQSAIFYFLNGNFFAGGKPVCKINARGQNNIDTAAASVIYCYRYT